MKTHRHPRRAGFTLIELLVVIAIAIGLMAMTIGVAFTALDRDHAAAAVTQIDGALQIAHSRAEREGLPYGIRLINNGGQSTAYQYIQSPAVFVPSNPAPDPTRYVQFDYTLDATGQIAPPAGAPVGTPARVCRIFGLSYDQQLRVTPNCLLYLPELGTWHLITATSAPSANVPPPPMTVTLNDPSFQYGYPDSPIGGATNVRTYYFGIYEPPYPVVGEEVRQLPQDICVDLSPDPARPRSYPLGTAGDYDILIAPSGKLVSVPPPSPNTGAVGHVFLWFRNPNRPDNLTDGGEQLLAVVKVQTGAFGGAPIDRGADPYALGRKAVAGH